MGFEKFGTVSFTSETKAADFVTHLEEGKVMATKCKRCGQAYFPPRMDCADCLDSEVEWFEEEKSSVNFVPGGVVFPMEKGGFAGCVKIGRGNVIVWSMGIPVSFI